MLRAPSRLFAPRAWGGVTIRLSCLPLLQFLCHSGGPPPLPRPRGWGCRGEDHRLGKWRGRESDPDLQHDQARPRQLGDSPALGCHPGCPLQLLIPVLHQEITRSPAEGARAGRQSQHPDGLLASVGFIWSLCELPRFPDCLRGGRLNTCFVFMIQRKKLKGPQGKTQRKKSRNDSGGCQARWREKAGLGPVSRLWRAGGFPGLGR